MRPTNTILQRCAKYYFQNVIYVQALGGMVGGNKHTPPRDTTHTKGV